MSIIYRVFIIHLIVLITSESIGQNREYLIYDLDTLKVLAHDNFHQSPIDIGTESVSNFNGKIYFELHKDSLFVNDKFSVKYFASNYNDSIYCSSGKLLYNIGEIQFFSKEILFVFVKGILQHSDTLYNETIISKYSTDQKVLYNYIKNNISNSFANQLENCVRIVFIIRNINDNGKIIDLELLKGCNKELNIEIERVIKTIPIWSVLFLHGEKSNYLNGVVIDFKRM